MGASDLKEKKREKKRLAAEKSEIKAEVHAEVYEKPVPEVHVEKPGSGDVESEKKVKTEKRSEEAKWRRKQKKNNKKLGITTEIEPVSSVKKTVKAENSENTENSAENPGKTVIPVPKYVSMEPKSAPKSTRICIKNLPKKMKEEELRKMLEEHGVVTDIKMCYEKSMKNDQAMKDKNGKIVKPKFRGFAFIGFRNLAQAETAQTKLHNTYWKNQKLHVEEAVSFKKSWKIGDPVENQGENSGEKNSAPVSMTKVDKITQSKRSNIDFLKSKIVENSGQKSLDEIDISETGRLMIRNLSYQCTEDDLEGMFKQFGNLNELNLIIDEQTLQNKGFGFVTYTFPENAVQAYEHLDGSEFQGRLIHLIPARASRGTSSGMMPGEKQQKLSSFKKRQLEKELEKDQQVGGDQEGHVNSSYINPANVAEVIAADNDVKKSDVALDLHDKDNMSAAVRLAVKEAGLTKEIADKTKGERSRSALVIKNIPIGVGADKVEKFFEGFGNVAECEVKNTIAVVEFDMSRAAKRAAKSVRGRDDNPLGKGAPLLIDWASKDWKEEQEKMETGEEVKKEAGENEAFYGEGEQNDADKYQVEPEEETTIFVKNLNFDTSDSKLRTHFEDIGKIHSVKISKKINEKTRMELSMGFGFVTFMRKKDAEKALRKLQKSKLDNHDLDLKKSHQSTFKRKINDPRANDLAKQAKQGDSYDDKNASTKICVRNVPFQANRDEIKKLFLAFSEDCQDVRMPLKVQSNQHRGYAFVEFTSKTEAKKCFNELSNGTHLYGRKLVLEWSKK